MLLLLLHLRSNILNVGAATIPGMRPFTFQLLYLDADVERVVARNVAVGIATVDLMSAAVGDELEIAFASCRSQHDPGREPF